MLVVGIDLAGVETRQTGFCILKNMKAKTSILYTDKEIIQQIETVKPRVIAIDAPLTLPEGRKSIDERTNIHLRECDKELLRRGIKFFPITIGPMRQLTKRGIKLKNILERKYRVIEVYPGGAQDILNIPRKQEGLGKLIKGLESLGIRGINKKATDHELDGITCALVGKMLLDGKAEILGSEDGIVMPKI